MKEAFISSQSFGLRDFAHPDGMYSSWVGTVPMHTGFVSVSYGSLQQSHASSWDNAAFE